MKIAGVVDQALRVFSILRAWQVVGFLVVLCHLASLYPAPRLFFPLLATDTSANWDQPELEAFVKEAGPYGKLYIDGVRPYFIRRSARADSRFFCDPKPSSGSWPTIANCESIVRCFGPDYWIVAKLHRTEAEFKSLREAFSPPIFSRDDAFVSKAMVKSLEPSTLPPPCDKLRMKG